jgi:uncharacterized membrane protein YfcA
VLVGTVLCLFAFLAGFVDAVVGGGGLIQLPALFICRPDMAIPAVLATNKMASIAGTAVALCRYARHVELDRKSVMPAVCSAFVFSFLGARTVSYLSPDMLRPLILLLLITVAVYTFCRKDLGSQHAPRISGSLVFTSSVVTGSVIGFYDGFFGPGTGSFLIFIFISYFGFDFLNASAAAKAVNFATNLSANLFFAWEGHINLYLAIPMGMFNILGSLAGTRMAILKGSRFVRVFFICVVSAIIVRFAYDLLHI